MYDRGHFDGLGTRAEDQQGTKWRTLDPMCRHAENRISGGNVPQHNAAGTDASEGSYMATRQHHGVRAHEDGLFDDDGPGDVGVAVERRERTDVRIVPDGHFQVQMHMIADRDVGGQSDVRAENGTDANFAVGTDDGRRMNDRGELCAALQVCRQFASSRAARKWRRRRGPEARSDASRRYPPRAGHWGNPPKRRVYRRENRPDPSRQRLGKNRLAQAATSRPKPPAPAM